MVLGFGGKTENEGGNRGKGNRESEDSEESRLTVGNYQDCWKCKYILGILIPKHSRDDLTDMHVRMVIRTNNPLSPTC